MILPYSSSKILRATWMFPKEFIAPPVVTMMRDYAPSLGTNLHNLNDVGVDYRHNCTNISVNLSIRATSAITFEEGDAIFVNAIAIGEWK